MPRISVTVDATTGSAIGRHEEGLPEGWPVGRGVVSDTLTAEGSPVPALVLMPEPALPSQAVAAWPVAVLHLDDGGIPLDEVVSVAEAECFLGLVDVPDLPRWHAEPEVWVEALARLAPGHRYHVIGCGVRDEAEHLVSDAQRAFRRLTGCLE